MCIIAASAIGQALPNNETIRTMWTRNSDGAGFMYNHNGKVVIKKGFMTLDAFMEAFNKTAQTIDLLNSAVVLHFRIGTSGGNIPQNTHPFPVTEKIPLLQKLENKCDLAVAHNGVLPIHPRNGISDTMEYVVSVLSHLKKLNRSFYLNNDGRKIVENTIEGDRMVFLDGNGKLSFVGNWVADNGIMYSNSGFRSFKDEWWDYPNRYDMAEADCYFTKSLYPVDDDKYIVKTPEGDYIECADLNADCMVDDNSNLYIYEYDFDLALKMTDYTVYDREFRPLHELHNKDEDFWYEYDCMEADKFDMLYPR